MTTPAQEHTVPTPPEPAPAGTPPRPKRILRFVVAGILTAGLAVGVLPDLIFGLDRRSPFAQLVAFRPLVLIGVLALALVLVVVTAFRRRAWPLAAGVVVVLAIGSAMVLPRAFAEPLPTGGTPLTVLSFNVLGGTADVDALAALIRTERPDLVSLPEAGDRFRSKLAPLVEPLGYRLQSSTPPGRPDIRSVTALVANRLGDVSIRIGTETAEDPYLEITGGSLGALRFVAFHSAAPVPGLVPAWQADLGLLPQWCAGPTPAIVAGDFNATLDHSVLRNGMAGCGDAAAQRGDGLIPTWGPSARQRSIGPQIDHVLATQGIAAAAFEVRDLPGSDHRAILTTLRVPASR